MSYAVPMQVNDVTLQAIQSTECSQISHLRIPAVYTQLRCCRAFDQSLMLPAVFQRILGSNIPFKAAQPPDTHSHFQPCPRGAASMSLWLANTTGLPAQLT